jgi:hypothetical protein
VRFLESVTFDWLLVISNKVRFITAHPFVICLNPCVWLPKRPPHQGTPFSVPMEKGKHRFPSRTPQLSPSSVTILGYSPGKIARCRIIEEPPERVVLLFYRAPPARPGTICHLCRQRWRQTAGCCLVSMYLLLKRCSLRNASVKQLPAILLR